MKILTVTYRINRPAVGSKYIHETVACSASVANNETPEQALAKLRTKVHAMIYPELVGLCHRVASVSPLVAKKLETLSEAQVAELYQEHADEFAQLLAGDVAPREFLRTIQDSLDEII